MFLKNLVEKLCSVFSLLLLFLFSLFSCVFLFKKKKMEDGLMQGMSLSWEQKKGDLFSNFQKVKLFFKKKISRHRWRSPRPRRR